MQDWKTNNKKIYTKKRTQISMKIGIILDSEFLTDIRVLNETRYLSKIGHEVFVLCLNLSNKLLYEEYNKIKIYRFTIKRRIKNQLYGLMNSIPLYEFIWKKKIEQFIINNDIQALHAHDLYMARCTHLANKHFKLPIVLDLHENYPEAILTYQWAIKFPNRIIVKPRKWKKKEARYLSYASRIIVLSDFYKKYLLIKNPSLNENNIIVFPNIPDVDVFQDYPIIPEITKKTDEFVVFYFGGISTRRGIFTCLEALEVLIKEKYKVRLLLIGPVDYEDLKHFHEWINKPIVKDHITYYPWKDISLLPSFIEISNLCISPILKNPQHESGVANKIFQYMLCNKPLLVSNCTPQVEIINESNCGLVFESGNSTDLCFKIKEFMGNPQLCKLCGANGKNSVLKKYNLENYGLNLKLLYNSFIDTN
jgi:glycosyltransferase involved in cell wall biosynthesis